MLKAVLVVAIIAPMRGWPYDRVDDDLSGGSRHRFSEVLADGRAIAAHDAGGVRVAWRMAGLADSRLCAELRSGRALVSAIAMRGCYCCMDAG